MWREVQDWHAAVSGWGEGRKGEFANCRCVSYTSSHSFFSCVNRGSYHMQNYLDPCNHFPDLLLGHPKKSTIADEVASLKTTGLGSLIIILFPLWEMSCTSSSVFFICRWFLLNCTIDPKMDRKPSSLSAVPKGVKASLDLWNSPGYTEALQHIEQKGFTFYSRSHDLYSLLNYYYYYCLDSRFLLYINHM